MGPTLYRYLSRIAIPVDLYAPYGTPKEEIDIPFLAQASTSTFANDSPGHSWEINPAYICLVEILARIEHEPYHWPVGRVTFQKIAYFATELGLPTGLHFVRGSYGPFSPDLRPLITRLVNNGLIQEIQLGRMFALKPGPTYRDAARAFQTELERWESIINRITDLFLRMRTQEAEVAATVYFTARALDREAKNTVSETAVLEGVKHWKQRRRPPLRDEEIAQAIRNLNLLGWINAQPSPDLPLPKEEALLDV